MSSVSLLRQQESWLRTMPWLSKHPDVLQHLEKNCGPGTLVWAAVELNFAALDLQPFEQPPEEGIEPAATQEDQNGHALGTDNSEGIRTAQPVADSTLTDGRNSAPPTEAASIPNGATRPPLESAETAPIGQSDPRQHLIRSVSEAKPGHFGNMLNLASRRSSTLHNPLPSTGLSNVHVLTTVTNFNSEGYRPAKSGKQYVLKLPFKSGRKLSQPKNTLQPTTTLIRPKAAHSSATEPAIKTIRRMSLVGQNLPSYIRAQLAEPKPGSSRKEPELARPEEVKVEPPKLHPAKLDPTNLESARLEPTRPEPTTLDMARKSPKNKNSPEPGTGATERKRLVPMDSPSAGHQPLVTGPTPATASEKPAGAEPLGASQAPPAPKPNLPKTTDVPSLFGHANRSTYTPTPPDSTSSSTRRHLLRHESVQYTSVAGASQLMRDPRIDSVLAASQSLYYPDGGMLHTMPPTDSAISDGDKEYVLPGLFTRSLEHMANDSGNDSSNESSEHSYVGASDSEASDEINLFG